MPDPRIAERIRDALGDARRIANVGAGTGSYEPDDRFVVGIEPSRPLPVPHDCRDGFLGAYWRRPHAYLDAGVRSSISTFATLPPAEVDAGLAMLRADLESGAWSRAHPTLPSRFELDVGYRLVSAELFAS